MELTDEEIRKIFGITDINLKKILMVLFVDGPLSIFKLEKKTNMPHATVHKKVKELLKMGLIKIDKQARFRTGLLTKTYKLTDQGYKNVLRYLNYKDLKDEQIQALSRLAKENPNINPAFEWWDVFMSGGELLKQFYLKHLFPHWEDNFPIAIYTLFSEEGDYDGLCFLHTTDIIDIPEEEIEKLKIEIINLLNRNKKFRDFIFENLAWWKRFYLEQAKDLLDVEKKLKEHQSR